LCLALEALSDIGRRRFAMAYRRIPPRIGFAVLRLNLWVRLACLVKLRRLDLLDILKRLLMVANPCQEEKKPGEKERNKESHGLKGWLVSVGMM